MNLLILVTFQLLHVEIASTCEPGSIGAVIVFVAVIIVAKICDDSPNCEVSVNGQQMSAHQTQRRAATSQRPVSPFKRRCNRSTQRDFFAPDESNPGRRRTVESFETPIRRASPFPVFTNGSAIKIGDVPRGESYMTSAKFLDFLTHPCHCHKSADFVSFVCFLGTLSPPPSAECGRHISMAP